MKRAQFLGLERGQVGNPFLKRGQDFDSLDGIDSQVMVLAQPGDVCAASGSRTYT